MGIKRKLFVGTPIRRRGDCGCVAKVQLSIRDKQFNTKTAQAILIPTTTD